MLNIFMCLTLLSNILLSLLGLFVLYFSSCIIHELSHLFVGVISSSKYKKNNPQLPKFQFKLGVSNTYSLWYLYLEDHHNDSNLHATIRLNCVAGYFGELVVLVPLCFLLLHFYPNHICIINLSYFFLILKESIFAFYMLAIKKEKKPIVILDIYYILTNFKIKALELTIKKTFLKNIKIMNHLSKNEILTNLSSLSLPISYCNN